MSETDHENGPDDGPENGSGADFDDEAERREIAEVQEQLDAQADGDGLAAEAGRGEEMGLSEG